MGLLLLAAVTSLPQLATGISAVTAAHSPNIAVGDVLGSTVFDLALLVMLDVLHRPDTIYSRASTGHVLSAGFGVILLGVVGAGVLLEREHVLPGFGSVGGYMPMLMLLYLLALRSEFSYGQREARTATSPVEPCYAGLSLRTASLQFAVFASVVTVACVWLPIAGSRIADEMGWTRTFGGTLLVPGATSLPEVVVTLAALRLRALDMAMMTCTATSLVVFMVVLDPRGGPTDA